MSKTTNRCELTFIKDGRTTRYPVDEMTYVMDGRRIRFAGQALPEAIILDVGCTRDASKSLQLIGHFGPKQETKSEPATSRLGAAAIGAMGFFAAIGAFSTLNALLY